MAKDISKLERKINRVTEDICYAERDGKTWKAALLRRKLARLQKEYDDAMVAA